MSSIDISKMSLVDAIKNRRSVRGFLDKPVPQEIINEVLTMAQQAPSNCNTQPWKVYVASGELRDSISEKLLERAKKWCASKT